MIEEVSEEVSEEEGEEEAVGRQTWHSPREEHKMIGELRSRGPPYRTEVTRKGRDANRIRVLRPVSPQRPE